MKIPPWLSRIDHLGGAVSADPDLFIYAVQEVLCVLLGQRDAVMESIRKNSVAHEANGLYEALVSTAIQMRQLTIEQRMAFWTSGYEADRLRLVETMKLAQLPVSDPRHLPPPHLTQLALQLKSCTQNQASRLHSLAQSGQFPKELRRQ